MPAPSQSKDVFQPSRLKAQRRKAAWVKRTLLLFCFLLLISLVVGFFYIPQLRVRDVSVTGTESIDPNAIANVLRENLLGRKYLVLPVNNAFLYK